MRMNVHQLGVFESRNVPAEQPMRQPLGLPVRADRLRHVQRVVQARPLPFRGMNPILATARPIVEEGGMPIIAATGHLVRSVIGDRSGPRLGEPLHEQGNTPVDKVKEDLLVRTLPPGDLHLVRAELHVRQQPSDVDARHPRMRPGIDLRVREGMARERGNGRVRRRIDDELALHAKRAIAAHRDDPLHAVALPKDVHQRTFKERRDTLFAQLRRCFG